MTGAGATLSVWAETTVSAAHRYKDYALHGHTYLVRVHVHPPVDAERLHHDLNVARAGVDHRLLNDVLPDPTMEALAQWFANALAPQHRVMEVEIRRPEGLGCRLTLA